MARIWKSAGREVLQGWIDTIIEEAEEKLNTWELKFISDMQIKVANGWFLTQAQEEKLESIYAEKTS